MIYRQAGFLRSLAAAFEHDRKEVCCKIEFECFEISVVRDDIIYEGFFCSLQVLRKEFLN